jgi:hypothetical protein
VSLRMLFGVGERLMARRTGRCKGGILAAGLVVSDKV